MSQAKVAQSRRGLRGIRRDRDCRNCKSRGVKCDLNRPRCLPCVQSELACGGYLQRVVWASNKTLDTSNSSDERTRLAGAAIGDEQRAMYLDTLASLNQALENANPVAFLGILVLAYFEVLSASEFGEWQFHLQGARSLLDRRCQSRKDVDQLWHSIANLPEMIAYLSWWDVAGVVIRHLSGSRAQSQERLIFLDWHRALIGVEFFDTVAKTADTSQESDKGALIAEQSRHVLAMEQLLQLGLVTNYQGMCRGTWRCAAAIALLTWDSPSQDTGDLTPDCRQKALVAAVDRICRAISSVPPTSRSLAQCKVTSGYWRNCQTGGVPRHLGALAQGEQRWKRIHVT
ncbi:hypothetical protein BGZ61DRAFT_499865 [Ilyonectria robusta]|uniref:uncharacterized protein n=1 Tax=Ilyonectria robusta TaxID=1079257 RepID=UPI001E8EF441|nr:uncharacterized protein BGZ61DRAFT_499865 [Ilyonectria robusta]KAH8658988.1 hypothetical protein BGZ61DRAFT_499865 [Ilyonectria robusta]